MIVIKPIDNKRALYEYFKKQTAPYFFTSSYEEWVKSLDYDIDGQGKRLFRELTLIGAYEDGALVGFIQYGKSALGFNENGEISEEISYQIIRNLYYDRNHSDVCEMLLEESMQYFNPQEKIYAFFHYFGMSVYARHGKLFEKYEYIEEFLKHRGFVVEHENIYYSMYNIASDHKSDIEIVWSELSPGSVRTAEFRLENEWIGECEVHFISNQIAYLRWIYIDEKKQNQRLGSRCIQTLLNDIGKEGYVRLDTDTAIDNVIAQHFYEKNGFKKEGVTRSFYYTNEGI